MTSKPTHNGRNLYNNAQIFNQLIDGVTLLYSTLLNSVLLNSTLLYSTLLCELLVQILSSLVLVDESSLLNELAG